MKGRLLALLALLTIGVFSTAQVRQGTFNQRGLAVQEMRDEGLCAAHPSLPIGSKARITNLANNEDIEVTITKRLQPSTHRIIDLSPGAALMLGFDLGKGGPVIVRATNLPPPPPVAVVQPELPAAPPPAIEVQEVPKTAVSAPAPAAVGEALPQNIIINNYIMNPEKPQTQEPAAVKQERPTRRNRTENEAPPPVAAVPSAAVAAAEEPVEAVPPAPATPAAAGPAVPPWAAPVTPPPEPEPEPPPPEPVPVQPAPVPEPPPAAARPVSVQPRQPEPAAMPLAEPPPLFNSPPVENIRIQPSLPDPNSNKMYRLHIGTYSSADQAYRAVQQLQAAGFDVSQEQTAEGRKVYASGVPAARVYYAAQRLGAIGFQQVWVYEQN